MTTTKLFSVAAILAALAPGNALAQKAAYAVVVGSVFQESGFSLPGATVSLTAKDAVNGKSPKSALKSALRTTTDARGEFAFRIPAVSGNYLVTASRKGFKAGQAEAAVGGEERVDVTIVLSAESK